jgi:hypothetical protein
MKINCDKFLLRKYVADSSKSCGKWRHVDV